ncbi:MAG: hypothetical protein E6G35_00015 [Actinobacteria bacterium]|nr:MAG: hypothetical protein E6G35_00015 [Actinomycetota bacterium]
MRSALRILCLHGYHGNAEVLRRQMAPLASALPSDVELVFVDAPSLSVRDFGWWHEGFSGWERTRDWVGALMSSGPPFDGIFGFSQGAALTGLLAAVRESEHPRPVADFGFAIMVGGFTSNLPQHARLFQHKLRIPSVHIIGRGDVIVPKRDSLLLADRFTDPLVIEHAGGHVIPGGAVATRTAQFLSEYARTARKAS